MLESFKEFKTEHFKVLLIGLMGSIFGLWLGEGFNSLSNFILGFIGMIFTFVVSAGLIDDSIEVYSMENGKMRDTINKKRFNEIPARFRAYFTCVCVLYAVCSFSVWIVSGGQTGGEVGQYDGRVGGFADYISPESCETQKRWTQDMFLVLIVPSLLGVRVAIGDRKRES